VQPIIKTKRNKSLEHLRTSKLIKDVCFVKSRKNNMMKANGEKKFGRRIEKEKKRLNDTTYFFDDN